MLFFRRQNKIDFLIIGAQKCGTTSLHHYLAQHPELLSSKQKEVDYFSYDGLYAKGSDWYLDQFGYDKKQHKNKMLFETSPEYFYMPYVAERIHKYNPKIKLIVLLRDPAERAVSAFAMYKKLEIGGLWMKGYLEHLKDHGDRYRIAMEIFFNELSGLSFEDCVSRELEDYKNNRSEFLYEPSLVKRGIYIDQLRVFLRYFDLNSFLFIEARSLDRQKVDTLNKVTDFVGAGSIDWNKMDLVNRLTNSERSENPDLQHLRSFYRDKNEELFSVIKQKYDW